MQEPVLLSKPAHSWLRTINLAYIPGPECEQLEEFVGELLDHFKRRGHNVQQVPDDQTDVILTTAPFDRPIGWREAPLFSVRRQFKLNRTPTVYSMVSTSRAKFQQLLDRFAETLKKDPPDPADYDFPGLSPTAYRVLYEQGHRGGPIMAVERLLQAYTKSIRVLLVVSDDHPESVYHFDLVGAFPESKWEEGLDAFYDDIVMRITTTMSTREVTNHQIVDEPISHGQWMSMTTPQAMQVAGKELGKRNFFTEMVIIENIVSVPAVSGSVASQYSEGCFSTWDSTVNGLVATVTGSSRPVDKVKIADDDLAVIVGVREGGTGAMVRQVEGKRNDPPSSEAVEMMDMDALLPQITLGPEWGEVSGKQVPVVRSKLHGHRGISAFDPRVVEYVPLDPPYYHYPVSCATEAQAQGIKNAFSRSEAFRNPDDPRQVAFTVLPGHGAVIAEKWVEGKVPFQTLWEFMDQGALQVSAPIPQGMIEYEVGKDEIARLKN
ncbi:MAG: hypothetical protein WCF84_20470 [Anaerolineae bacterium]